MAPDWFIDRLGWKEAKSEKPVQRCIAQFGRPYGPNLADLAGPSSTLISGEVYRLLGIPPEKTTEFNLGELEQDDDPAKAVSTGGVRRAEGTVLELGLEEDLRDTLTQLEVDRGWHVTRSEPAHEFAQFAHTRELERVLRNEAVITASRSSPNFLAPLPATITSGRTS